jgi:outer membrane lipoprotein-sorting protein
MAYRKPLLMAALLCISFLQAINLDTFYSNMHQRYDAIKSMQADVTQVNEFVLSKSTLTSYGKLYYQPGKLLITYNKPHIQKLLVSNGLTQVYDQDSKTLIKSKTAANMQSANPLMLVDQFWQDSKKEIISEDSTQITLRLIPNTNKNVKQIKTTFSLSTYLPRELSYSDASGNTVRYKFRNLRTGQNIPPATWNLQVPTGTRIHNR